MSHYPRNSPLTEAERRRYYSGDLIECLLCGVKRKSLSKHLTTSHGVTASEYKKQFGLYAKDGLVGTATRAAYSEAALNTHQSGVMDSHNARLPTTSRNAAVSASLSPEELRRSGVKVAHRNLVVDPADVEKVLAMVAEGEPVSKAAISLGYAYATFKAALDRSPDAREKLALLRSMNRTPKRSGFKVDLKLANGALLYRTTHLDPDDAVQAFRALLTLDQYIGQNATVRLRSPLGRKSLFESRYDRDASSGRILPTTAISIMLSETGIWTPQYSNSEMSWETDQRPFPDVLLAWHIKRSWSVQRAANEMRVPLATYQGWLRGRRCLLEKTVRRLMIFIDQAN